MNRQPLLLSAALAVAGSVTISLGLAGGAFYHETCKWLGIAKPALMLPWQLAGLAAVLFGVGYLFSIRRPREWRFLLLLGLIGSAVASLLTLYAISKGKLPSRALWPVIGGAVFVLLPLAVAVRRVFGFELVRTSNPGDAWQAENCNQNIIPRPLGLGGRLALVALVMLPAAWAVGRAIDQIRWRSAPTREPRWLTFTSSFPKRTGDVTPFCAVDAFPNARFVDPLFVTELPDGSGRLAVLERRGRMLLLPKNGSQKAEKEVFLDITDRTMKVPGKAEDGLLGVAFHPQFNDAASPHRGKLFVHYTADVGEGRRMNRLSSFVVPPGKSVADAGSEQILIDTPDEKQSHNGGSVEFGPDGFLYLALGDDSRHFPNHHAQNICGDLFSGILRIDVDCRGGNVSHAPARQPTTGKTAHYFIPNDNPFVGQLGVLEEFYSIGFRNPWRMSFDRHSGTLWVGDVGDRRREEVNVAFAGSNHQWAYREGSIETTSYDEHAQGVPQPLVGIDTPPVFEYERDSMDRCVIGGYVYRGKKFPELVGKYVFADQSGRIQALTLDDDGGVVRHELIALLPDAGLGVSSLGEDAEGELYICCIRDLCVETGVVFRLERTVRLPAEQMPPTLAATGLFSDMKTLRPSASLIEYEVNSPLWSDRALKKRWIGMVSQERIGGDLNGTWRFPAGTVFVKHFDLPLDERPSAGSGEFVTQPLTTAVTHAQGLQSLGELSSEVRQVTLIVDTNGEPIATTVWRKNIRRLETRVLVIDDRGGWYAATYRWNDDETDAVLIDFNATEQIEYVDAHGQRQSQEWLYPGRFECLTCHTTNSGGVLGFTAKQLHRDLVANGLRENQLSKFAAAGMFEFDCTDAELATIPRLVAHDDATASVELRARSYLDANCSHCHRPGSRFGGWDARVETPLDQAGIIDGTAYMHRGSDARSRIVSPGDLQWSFLHIRQSSNERFMRMPPLGRNVVHTPASDLLAEWINSMPRIAPTEKPDDKTD